MPLDELQARFPSALFIYEGILDTEVEALTQDCWRMDYAGVCYVGTVNPVEGWEERLVWNDSVSE